MKDRLTIGQFAKLRNVTTETLRHYDRIGLLKPAYTDPETGYRYYSIIQEERLGTIRELRQLGIDIETIQKYFTNRNFKQSVEILREKHLELKDRILQLQELEKHINEKLTYLDSIQITDNPKEITLKHINERKIITYNEPTHTIAAFSYAFVQLESSLNEIAPILGTNRIGSILNPSSEPPHSKIESYTLFLFHRGEENVSGDMIQTIPSGDYICSYFTGSIFEAQVHYENMLKHITRSGYSVCGRIIQLIHIDVSMTDDSNESLYELQFPVKFD